MRNLARDADRSEVSEVILGETLAHSPAEHDEIWPCIPVRNLIEKSENDKLENGIDCGIINKRGVTWGTGGRDERELALQYRKYAKSTQINWPRTAALLERIADDYDRQARNDEEGD